MTGRGRGRGGRAAVTRSANLPPPNQPPPNPATSRATRSTTAATTRTNGKKQTVPEEEAPPTTKPPKNPKKVRTTLSSEHFLTIARQTIETVHNTPIPSTSLPVDYHNSPFVYYPSPSAPFQHHAPTDALRQPTSFSSHWTRAEHWPSNLGPSHITALSSIHPPPYQAPPYQAPPYQAPPSRNPSAVVVIDADDFSDGEGTEVGEDNDGEGDEPNAVQV